MNCAPKFAEREKSRDNPKNVSLKYFYGTSNTVCVVWMVFLKRRRDRNSHTRILYVTGVGSCYFRKIIKYYLSRRSRIVNVISKTGCAIILFRICSLRNTANHACFSSREFDVLIVRFSDSGSNPESGPNSPPTVNNSQASPTAGSNTAIQEVSSFSVIFTISTRITKRYIKYFVYLVAGR